MDHDLETMLEAAKRIETTPGHREEQRRSFAYGNTRFENELITRGMVDAQAAKLDEQEADEQR